MLCSFHRQAVKLTATLAVLAWTAMIGISTAADVAIEGSDGGSRVTIRANPPSVVVEAQADRVYDGSSDGEPAKPRTPKHATITIGDDSEFTSFSQLVESDPWLAALIFMSV